MMVLSPSDFSLKKNHFYIKENPYQQSPTVDAAAAAVDGVAKRNVKRAFVVCPVFLRGVEFDDLLDRWLLI